MGKKFPPGFRFHPTDVELIKYHLKRKVLGKKFHMETIAEVDIYKFAPWDLPSKSLLQTGDLKWFFFCPREKRYVNGSRAKRATESGYWKTTGKDRVVRYNDVAVGSIKTLIFHQGKAPKGDRTDWVMYEYKLEEKELADRGVVQDSYVLCAVFKKTGLGPKNGAQYGAPFREEDWDDDDDDHNGEDEEVLNGGGVIADPSAVAPDESVHQVNNVASTSLFVPETETGSTVLCPSETVTSVVNTAIDCCGASSDLQQLPPPQDEDDELGVLLDRFIEQDTVMNNFNAPVQQVAEVNQGDELDIYDGLVDLGSLAGFGGQHNAFDKVGIDKGQYLELMDLEMPLDGSAETAGRHVQAGGNHDRPFFGWDYGYG